MDGSFHAIAIILHRVPRDGEPRGKRKAGEPPQGDRETVVHDIPDGWVRFAL